MALRHISGGDQMVKFLRHEEKKLPVIRRMVYGYFIVIFLSGLIAAVAIVLIGRIQQANNIIYRKIMTSLLYNAEITNQLYERQMGLKNYLNGGRDLSFIFLYSDTIDYNLDHQISTLDQLDPKEFSWTIAKLRQAKAYNQEYQRLLVKLEKRNARDRLSVINNIDYLNIMISNLLDDIYLSLSDLGRNYSQTVDRNSTFSKVILGIIALIIFGAGLMITRKAFNLAILNEEQHQRVLQEERTRLETEKVLAETQLQVLQSQINPHFLFNTLNVIARTALLEGAAQSENLIYSLAGLLRYSLRHVGEMVTLAEELKCINKYFDIQKVRFGEGILLGIDTNEAALEFKIPSFTLQPLVENAIVHGLKPNEMEGKIQIHAMLVEDRFSLSIEDNGAGMSDDVIHEIWENSKILGREKEHITGLGLANVIQRLQYAFGERVQTDIHSTQGDGTRITIVVKV